MSVHLHNRFVFLFVFSSLVSHLLIVMCVFLNRFGLFFFGRGEVGNPDGAKYDRSYEGGEGRNLTKPYKMTKPL